MFDDELMASVERILPKLRVLVAEGKADVLLSDVARRYVEFLDAAERAEGAAQLAEMAEADLRKAVRRWGV